MFLMRRELLLMADSDSVTPSFTQSTPGAPSEDSRDESDIMTDQDSTRMSHLLTDEESVGAGNALEAMEDEPGDFMRGELDVKEQMDRAATALDASLRGYQSQADEDSPRTELGASFRETPGGLEEVAQKTDQYLATHGHPHKPTKKHAKDEGHTGHRGHETGAYTDIGAGRSGVTRTVDSKDKEDLH